MKLKLLILLLFPFIIHSQQATLAELELKLNSEKNQTKKLEIISEMVNTVFGNDMKQALVLAKKGVKLADQLNNKNWQPKFYEMEGRMHANLLQLDSANLFFDKAMKGYKAINDVRGQASTSFKMAWVLKKKGEYDKAMQKNIYALKLMESIDDKAGICDAMTRISWDLTKQNRLTEALNYAEKAIDMAEKNNLTSEFFYVYNNAGDVAIAMKKNQLSLDYFNKAAAIVEEQNLGLTSKVDIGNSQGNALKKLGRYDEAIRFYTNCLKMAKEANYQNGINTVTANLGEINLLKGNYKEALPYQLETVRLQETNNDKANLIENYHHVSTIYQKLNDFESALSYKQKAYDLRDSIGSIESDAKMSELLTKYETEKKEETIAFQEAKISQQKLVQYLGIIVVGLLLGLLIFGFISYRNRSKSNRLLAQKNAENELLMKEIHHRVKNNLEIVSSLLALQSAQIDDTKTKEAMTEGQNRVNSISIVHQKLYQGTNLGSIEMKDYFLNLSQSILDSFGAEEKVKLNLAMEKLDLDIDTAVPLGLIINELLTNTIKYAFPEGDKGTITIKLEKQNDQHLHLVVTDNGIGKSGITHGTGFGTQLVSLLTQQLNGTMKEESENGTTHIFDFKLRKAA
ncbi:MAG TPA: tetratricopeptide repeat protein [Flavobacterium sp.]|uniref:tetratricopeptide repeat-containing sensor histidine kinase n=2 Tax=Flavobacterium TaxID=237 RepID=UPI0025C6329C|nr:MULTISPECIES: tetratricopeptide repeat protein [unclassified Flavobacterium]HRE77975.1 tetratricopeptide repeat protein [Flavobacterium sp.]